MNVLNVFSEQLRNVKGKTLLSLLEQIEAISYENLFTERIDPAQTVVTGKGIPVKNVLETVANYRVQHFIQMDRNDFFVDVITSAMMLKKAEQFLTNPLPFFINNFEADPTYKAYSRKINFEMSSTEEKNRVITEAGDFIERGVRTKNFKQYVQIILDEMIMNAFYNGPVDNKGNFLYKNQDRSVPVKLNHKVHAFIASDTKRLVVGCEDPFGSLDQKKLLQVLMDKYKEELVEPSLSTKGAGLGCKMMIDNSVAFYVVVKKNVKTMFFCTIHLGVNLRKMESTSKNLHFCFY